MDSDDFLETIRNENQTALSRIGSSKSLYAFTGGDMDAETIESVAAGFADVNADLFGAWPNEVDEDTDEELTAFYAKVADEEGDWYDDIGAEVSGEDYAFHEQLREFTDPVTRTAGLVGYTLVELKLADQFVGFYVGNADPQTAQTYRDRKAELEARLDSATEHLARICTDDADEALAEETASNIVQSVYEVYTARLEEMGVNPKPVC
ncbi:rubrerythrin family protein [Haloarchaeobius amylolyticus]|uniref:rubrerythrin family protein n=1 Tax=Haloarchaeobius amylolyticus TaxID=1198296 RepID=UPI0022700CE9|nr:rubrerythrin family protein [Haloarchaeobius amylolyticus]